MSPERLDDLLVRMANCRVLVAGDLMLDEFIWGRVRRISPEAPVPIVEVQRESSYPGGSANVARNLREFCAAVEVMGVIGGDVAGIRLRTLLEEAGIGLSCVLSQDARPTILKTRIIARHQQVVRVDREICAPLTAEESTRLLELLEAMLPSLDAIILQDYGKGFFTQDMVDRMVAAARRSRVVITADINPTNPLVWSGLDVVKPNRAEAFAAAGAPWSEPVDPPLNDLRLIEVGRTLRHRWNCGSLLVTLGEQGMMLFDDQGEPWHSPTRAREVFDVSGAGDTAIALLTLALASGASPREAAVVSNYASGVAVGKLGTATVSPNELRASFASTA